MRALKFLIGLLLLPLCVAEARAALDLLRYAHEAAGGGMPRAVLWFLGGFAIWIITFFAMTKPMRAYVLAHELTHAVWGVAMGAKVSKLKVRETGGSVNLSKTNFLIALAPYFFPLYTVLVLLARWLLNLFWDLGRYDPFWLALVGLTWAFHLTFTALTLGRRQPDVEEHGRLFSYVVICLFNLGGVVLWIVAVTPAGLNAGWRALSGHTADAYGAVGRALYALGSGF